MVSDAADEHQTGLMSAYFVKMYYKIFKEYCENKDPFKDNEIDMLCRILATLSMLCLLTLAVTHFKCNEMTQHPNRILAWLFLFQAGIIQADNSLGIFCDSQIETLPLMLLKSLKPFVSDSTFQWERDPIKSGI